MLNAGGDENSSYPDLFIITRIFVWNCHTRFHKYVKILCVDLKHKRGGSASYEGWRCKWGQEAGIPLPLLMVTSMKGHLHVLGSVDRPGRRAVVPFHPLPVDCQHRLTQIY